MRLWGRNAFTVALGVRGRASAEGTSVVLGGKVCLALVSRYLVSRYLVSRYLVSRYLVGHRYHMCHLKFVRELRPVPLQGEHQF